MASRLMKSFVLLASVCVGAITSAPARAADINYIELFRTKAIKCIHGTVNPEKATIEITKGPDVAGEITTVRFKTFYEGLIKKNVMETELMIRQAGSIRQMKINTLSDTGTGGSRCALEKTWTDF